MKRLLLPLIFFLVVGPMGCNKTGTAPSPVGESVRERVLRTGKIRVAWAEYKPLCMRDPTGKRVGIGVEIIEEIGKRLKLDVEWGEEVGWGNLFEELRRPVRYFRCRSVAKRIAGTRGNLHRAVLVQRDEGLGATWRNEVHPPGRSQ